MSIEKAPSRLEEISIDTEMDQESSLTFSRAT